MKTALAQQILEGIQGLDIDPAKAKMRLIFVIKVILCGNYVGSCPYCSRGDIFQVKDIGAVNLGDLGKDGCCCRDLVKSMEDLIK
jgi:hypothetical protein